MNTRQLKHKQAGINFEFFRMQMIASWLRDESEREAKIIRESHLCPYLGSFTEKLKVDSADRQIIFLS